MRIHYYDILSKKELSLKIVKCRDKIGLKNTVGVYMSYEDYKKLKEEVRGEEEK